MQPDVKTNEGFLKLQEELEILKKEREALARKIKENSKQIEKRAQWKTWLEAMKGSGFGKDWILRGAYNFDLNVIDYHQDIGWLRNSFYFTVEGKESDVKAFQREFYETVRAYNSVKDNL